MITQKDIWEITIINETNDGYLVMSPDGETKWVSHQDYLNYLNNKK
jgi:hypothetical protein